MKKTSLNLVDLDFDSIRNSIRNYLRGQHRYNSYDFDAPNLSILIDVLAYNANKHAFFTHMDISESFLDSAQLRDSIHSISKELNYLPRSRKSAKARVNVSFRASKVNQPYIIDKGSTFTTEIKNKIYTFCVPETITCYSATSNFSFETDIYEGVYIKDSYIYKSTVSNQRFLITDKHVDTSSVSVTVTEDNAENGVKYTYKSNMLGVTEKTRAFFIQPAEDGRYEVVFGDGIVGKEPKNGSTITIDYRVTNGDEGNGGKYFLINFDPTSPYSELTNSPTVTTIEGSSEGYEREDIESVRYYAPRHFQVQERAIVYTDYEIMLKTQFPEINACVAYGGEELSPPQFGKVFISMDIKDVDGIPDSKKDEYYSFIKDKCSLNITPVFEEADFLYASIDCNVNYNINITDQSVQRIRTLVTDTIKNYNLRHLNGFNKQLKYSNLITDIDEADNSIINNTTNIIYYKKINPILNSTDNIYIKFKIPLNNNIPIDQSKIDKGAITTVFSSIFTYRGQSVLLEDDGEGNIYIVKSNTKIHSKNKNARIIKIGNVNYNSGYIVLRRFNINNYENDALKIYVYPKSKDVKSEQNTILTIENEEIKVTVNSQRE